MFGNIIRFFKKPIIDLSDKLPMALVIIDMQEYFFEDYSTNFYRIKKVIKNLQKLIMFCNKVGMPVIFIEHLFKKPMMRNQWNVEFQERKTTTSELYDSANRKYLIQRNHDNGFYHTYLDKCSGFHPLLQKLRIKGLIIAGINGYSCVAFTNETAHSMGYEIIMANDIICDYRDFEFSQKKYHTTTSNYKATFFDSHSKLISSLERVF